MITAINAATTATIPIMIVGSIANLQSLGLTRLSNTPSRTGKAQNEQILSAFPLLPDLCADKQAGPTRARSRHCAVASRRYLVAWAVIRNPSHNRTLVALRIVWQKGKAALQERPRSRLIVRGLN